ncbi:MAG: hypothetical protein LBF34_01560 [Puniceicoccales bacterium]|jgi:hypothetical protein|nr:hypothetical protein [Puniceicoccales bacterium]
MKIHTLWIEVIGGFFLIIFSAWGSESVTTFSADKVRRRPKWGRSLTFDVCKRMWSRDSFMPVFIQIERSCGLKADEFRQLPLVFQNRVMKFQESCHLCMIREIKKMLQEFLQTMSLYKHYAAEWIFFKAINFIIRRSDLQYNSKICELLEAIEQEFQNIEEFIVPHPRYPLFSGVMPWHDDPLGNCIDNGDKEGLKEALRNCLVSDSIHNVPSGDTGGLFEIYRWTAQRSGVWDTEIDTMFRELAEKYSMYQPDLLDLY